MGDFNEAHDELYHKDKDFQDYFQRFLQKSAKPAEPAEPAESDIEDGNLDGESLARFLQYLEESDLECEDYVKTPENKPESKRPPSPTIEMICGEMICGISLFKRRKTHMVL